MENQQKIEKDLKPIFDGMTDTEKAACFKVFEKLFEYNGEETNFAIGYCWGATKQYEK